MNLRSYLIFILATLMVVLFLPFPSAASAASAVSAAAADREQNIPDCLLSYQFGPEQHILVVEKSTQNLFVYSNYSTVPVESFKITSGKNHGPKMEEGDMRTPEGIYFFKSILYGGDLPKTGDYGEKAFTLNYPNPIDRKDSKDGSGIWLHGAFDGEKIGIPNNSRGCVVMKNEDLIRLSRYIFLNRTPICIYNKIQYESAENIQQRRDRLIRYLKEWKSNWEDKNIDGYIDYYAPDFSNDGMTLEQFKAYKQQLNQRYRFMRIILSDINLYSFKNYYMVMFNQLYISEQNHFYSSKIQYWKDFEDKARIVDEFGSRLPLPAKFEFTRGNYITIEEFRRDYLKQMASKTITFAPAEIRLKNIAIFGDTVKLFLAGSGNLSGVRVIPVLKLETNGNTTLKSLEGITLEDGAPRGYAGAVVLGGKETTVVMKIGEEAQLKSLTLFLVNRENNFEQIITYFINVNPRQ